MLARHTLCVVHLMWGEGGGGGRAGGFGGDILLHMLVRLSDWRRSAVFLAFCMT